MSQVDRAGLTQQQWGDNRLAARIDAADIVVVTVNDHEHREIRNSLRAVSSQPGRECEGASRQPYMDFGLINGQKVVHVRSAMGSTDSGGSRHTTQLALTDLRPKLVIAVGLAWGANEKTQEIGDVLISRKIQIGDHKKVVDGSVIPRGPMPEVDGVLVKHFEETASKASVRHKVGLMYSLQTLFDDLPEKEKYLAAREEAIGGEMECSGIYEAIRDAGVGCSYIIVKAICDWGYKKNVDGAQKEKNQKIAAKRAANLCAKAIKSWSLVQAAVIVLSDPEQSSLAEDRKESPGQCENPTAAPTPSGLDAFVSRLQEQDLDIEYRGGTGHLDLAPIIYWPVRLRTPNVVHAVQTFIAAGLKARGCVVRLCFDDLGRIEGFASKSDGIETFKKRVHDWASRVTSPEVASELLDGVALFSDYVGDGGDRSAMPGALEQLGLGLVKWLKEKEQLREVLSEAKLMNGPEQAALDKKPRRLLTPPLVWTVLKMLNDGNGNMLTLGGSDEKPIWLAFESGGLRTSPVSNILIPKVTLVANGQQTGDRVDMDSDRLRVGSPHDIREALDQAASSGQSGEQFREWIIKYAWHLPEVVRGQPATTITEKLKTDSWHAAQQIAEFVRQ